MEEDRDGGERFMSIEKFIAELIAYRDKITELQASEAKFRLQTAALQETLDRFQGNLDHLPQKIFLKDRNSLYLWANEPYSRYLGIPRQEVPGKRDDEFFPPEAAGRSLEREREVIEKGLSLEQEDRYQSDGKSRVEKTVTSPLKNGSGETVGILGVCWDLAEHKTREEELEKRCTELLRLLDARGQEVNEFQGKFQAEQAERQRLEARMRDLENHFSAVFENGGAALAFIEENRVISRVNGLFESFSGYPRGEVEGTKRWDEIIRREQPGTPGESANPADLPSLEPMQVFTFLDRDNRGKTISLNAARIPETNRILVSLTDMTRYRQAREELDRVMRRLSEMMGETEKGIRILEE